MQQQQVMPLALPRTTVGSSEHPQGTGAATRAFRRQFLGCPNEQRSSAMPEDPWARGKALRAFSRLIFGVP